MAADDRLKSMLLDCVREYADEAGLDVMLNGSSDVSLLGADSVVDSLGLVMIVTSYEAKLNEAFDAGIVLASEQAMSMRHSPFRSVDALAGYAEGLLHDARSALASAPG